VATVRRIRDRWQVRWRGDDGRQRAKVFAKKVDADRFASTTEHQLATGSYIDPNAGRATFAEVTEAWLDTRVWRPSSEAQARSLLTNHVLPVLGRRPIASIRPSEVQALVKGLGERLAPATVWSAYKWTASIFTSAVDDRLIAASPCSRSIRLPKTEPTQVVPLTVEQVSAITTAMPERYRALVTFMAGVGVRQSEAFGVTLDRVDFLRRQVTVDRQLLTPSSGGPPEFAPLKTEASYRTVPLPDVVLDALAAHLTRWPVDREGLVFTSERGEPIARAAFRRAWRTAVTAAGVEATGHDLRHFYASLLIRHGESPKVVAARLGHASAAMTLNVYSHLWPDSDERTRQAVDAVLAAGDVHAMCTPEPDVAHRRS
jgi:integrase